VKYVQTEQFKFYVQLQYTQIFA